MFISIYKVKENLRIYMPKKSVLDGIWDSPAVKKVN